MVRKSPVAEEKTPLRDASTSTEAPPPLLARLDKAICDDPLHPFALGRNLRSIIKPAPDQLAVLDGLRAIAVLWVVCVAASHPLIAMPTWWTRRFTPDSFM